MRVASMLGFVGALGIVASLTGAESSRVLTVDHYVKTVSTVPAINGQPVQLYIRERVRPEVSARPVSADRVVLFVHGAGTPAEVSFDVTYHDYSWMAYLADAGFDVFSVDMTGYGRSARPWPMSDPCNLSAEQQKAVIPSILPAPCAPTYPRQLTSLRTDADDVNAAVEYIVRIRNVPRVHLIAWSLGGPRTAIYASRHADRIGRMVLLAPAYVPAGATPLAVSGDAMTLQTQQAFDANWDRQIGCPAQVEPEAREAVWSQMLDSDPVGATWGAGGRRAPEVTRDERWTPEMARANHIPTLMVSGEHDKQVAPANVRALYEALGGTQKVFADMACSSHNAMWERNHLLLFQASREWLTDGTVNGHADGIARLGYAGATAHVQ